MKKVTVIIPVYNTEKFMKKCIDSVIAQTYKNLEIILVDDGSPDGAPKICDEYTKKDDRIKVIHKKNEGLGYARNSGLDATTGDYVTFVDSDDWVDEEHIYNLVKGFDENIDVVIGSHKRCTYEEEIIKKAEQYYCGKMFGTDVIDKVIPAIVAPEDSTKREIGIEMCVWSNLYDMELIRKHSMRFISERYCIGEDGFFNIEYLSKSRGVNFVESYGYNYRCNPKSITGKYRKERAERTRNYYFQMKDLAERLNITDALKDRIERGILSRVRTALNLISNSDMSFKDKYNEYNKILKSDYVTTVFKTYDIKKLRSSVKITSFCMKNQLILITMLIFKLKNMASK